jgi:hypothetical protein
MKCRMQFNQIQIDHHTLVQNNIVQTKDSPLIHQIEELKNKRIRKLMQTMISWMKVICHFKLNNNPSI